MSNQSTSRSDTSPSGTRGKTSVQWSRLNKEKLNGHPRHRERRAERPLRIIDDAGFREPKVHFGGPIETPNFARAAGRGDSLQRVPCRRGFARRLTAALLNRTQQPRSGLWLNHRVLRWAFPLSDLALRRTPLPVLKDNGYSTAIFGKWHLNSDGHQGTAAQIVGRTAQGSWTYFYGSRGRVEPMGPLSGRKSEDNQYRRRTATPSTGTFPDAMADRVVARTSPRPGADKPFLVSITRPDAARPHHVAVVGPTGTGEVRPGWDRLRQDTLPFARRNSE